MHESLEKIKEYCGYYDWYDHVSIYDIRYLIAQAEKIERYEKAIESKVVCDKCNSEIRKILSE